MFDTNVRSNTSVSFPPPQSQQAVAQQTKAAVSGQQVEQQEEFMMTQAKTYLTGGAFDKEVAEFQANAMLETGYKTLDRIQPFYPGVYCIGAIPSLGKTTFSAQMTDQVAETGRPVLYFSLEQTAFELYSKSLARGFFKTCERQRRANNALTGSYPTPSSTAIRNGSARFAYPAELAQQIDAYVQSVGDRVCVITKPFAVTVEDIVGQTERYTKFDLPVKKKIKDFSRGMKVKLAFAVALSHKAELLILDEATSGLDPIIRDDILDILIDFVQDENHSVLFSTHITSDLEKVADYITFIHKGKLIFSCPKDELTDNYGVVICGAAVFDSMDKSEIVAYRKQDFQYRVLVRDRRKAEKSYPKAIVESASIDDIMLLYVKGEIK